MASASNSVTVYLDSAPRSCLLKNATGSSIRKVYFCYYCTIISASVLSNGGVLARNILMSGSAGGARCYVRPPLKRLLLQHGLIVGKNYWFEEI